MRALRMRAALLLLLSAVCVHADLDLQVPPGSVLDWKLELYQPIPTGERGRVPTIATKVQDKKPESGTRIEDVEPKKPLPPTLNIGPVGLYGYFRITTIDIMAEGPLAIPKKQAPNEIPTNVWSSGIHWSYKPDVPVELAWIPHANFIRCRVHPELVSEAEIEAYILEIGDAALLAAKQNTGKVANRAAKAIGELPEAPPVLKPATSLYEGMMRRLVATELTSGYPYALDPMYARRTLALGARVYDVIAAFTQDPHSFLARNAVAVLVNFDGDKNLKLLRELFEKSKDPVIRMRALAALARLRDKGAIDLLLKALDQDDVFRIAAIQALGQIGDPRASEKIIKITKDEDTLWTAVTALARIADGSKATQTFLKQQLFAYEQKAKKFVKPKPSQGPQLPIGCDHPAKPWSILEMLQLALAANGDADMKKKVTETFEKEKFAGFIQTTHFLLGDVLAKINPALLKKYVEAAGEVPLALNGVRCYIRASQDDKYLKKLANGEFAAAVRGQALAALFDRNPEACQEAAAKIIETYADGGGLGGSDNAVLVVLAVQVLGKFEKNNAEMLVKAARRAISSEAWAKRVSNEDPDITKAKVEAHPPLLEVILIELGRTLHERAPDMLLEVLKNPKSPARAEAALGLANYKYKPGIEALVASLEDRSDGWLRFCAYEALKTLSGEDYFCDWIFGSEEQAKEAALKYRDWAKKQ